MPDHWFRKHEGYGPGVVDWAGLKAVFQTVGFGPRFLTRAHMALQSAAEPLT